MLQLKLSLCALQKPGAWPPNKIEPLTPASHMREEAAMVTYIMHIEQI